MGKISQAELNEWNDSEKLADAIERQLILDVLEDDPHLIRTRKLSGRLDSMLNAWRDWANIHRDISKELGYKCALGEQYKRNGALRFHEHEPKGDFTNQDMEWIDNQIHKLELPEREAIAQETLHKGNKHHRDNWLKICREGGCKGLLIRSYPAALSAARGHLTTCIVQRFR